jgi:tetratricopeptide (TPR) repeat protein
MYSEHRMDGFCPGSVRFRPWLIVLLISLAHVTAPAPAIARASGGAQKNKEAARKVFKQADNEYTQGNFEKALVLFKKALLLYRHPSFIFNIAQCHRQLGQYKKALFFYKLYISEKPDAPNAEEVQERIKEMEQKARAKAARSGKLSVTSKPSGAAIYVDRLTGRPVGTTPKVLSLRAGQRLVVLRAAGHREVRRTVTIKAGEIAQLAVTLPRLKKRTPRPRFYKTWWFWTGASVTIGLAGAAAATGVLALEKNKDCSNDDIVRQCKLYRALTDAFWITAVVGAVGTAVGAIVWELQRGKERAATRAVVTPACSSSGCSIWVTGRF